MKQKRNVNAAAVRNFRKRAQARLETAKLSVNPFDVRIELAYDVLLFSVMAMLEASKLQLDSDRGHHRDAMQHLITTLGLRGKNEEGVMLLYALRGTRYDAAQIGTAEQAEEAATLAEGVLAEVDGWFEKNHPDLR